MSRAAPPAEADTTGSRPCPSAARAKCTLAGRVPLWPHGLATPAASPRKPNFVTRTGQRMVQPPARRRVRGHAEPAKKKSTPHTAPRATTCGTPWASAAWGMVFPVLTIVVTQLVGVEQAGMFSHGVRHRASLLMFVAQLRRAHLPGVRPGRGALLLRLPGQPLDNLRRSWSR